MTEEYIELCIEREMDQLDRLLIEGVIDQDEYDSEVNELDKWALEMYRNG